MVPGEGYLTAADRPLGDLRAKPDVARRDRTWITAEQLPAVLEAAASWHPRDAALLECLFWSRRRSSELRSVRIRDIDLAPRPGAPHGVLAWDNTKAHRYGQSLTVNAQLHRAIRDWLGIYERLAGEKPRPGWFLFPALVTAGITAKGMRRRMVLDPGRPVGQADGVVRKALRAAGLYRPGAAAHALRRGSATQLYADAAAAGTPTRCGW